MALMNTLVDTFNWGIGARWTSAGSAAPAQVTAVAGGVQIAHTTTSGYNQLNSVSTYDLTNNAAFWQVTDYGNMSIPSHEIYIKLCDTPGETNALMFYAAANVLQAYREVASTRTKVGSDLALNTATHKWLRIRHASTTIFWDTAPDGATWTNRWSLATPITITALKAQFMCGIWQNEASGSQMRMDNFNTVDARSVHKPMSVAVRRSAFY